MPNCHKGDIGLGASIILAFQAAVWKQHGIGVQGGGREEASLTLLKPLAKLSLTFEHAGRAPTEKLQLNLNVGGLWLHIQ